MNRVRRPLDTIAPVPPLYPPTDLRARHEWAVGHHHRIEVREYGAADGTPTLVLHGGPGSGGSPLLHRFLDPQRHRIVCVDQRGAGASRPRGSTEHNTLDDLLADLRQVRRTLGIDRWVVVGGSWGATLALCHAADAPDAVSALLLRASFLARDEDVDAFFADAAAAAADDWAHAGAPSGAPPALRSWLARTLQGRSRDAARAAARAWWRAERALAGAGVDDPPPEELDRLVDRYRIQSHYLMHGCFLRERPLLARCAQVPRVPTVLLHGRADRVCPAAGGQQLHAALPGSRLELLDGVGHDPTHPAMVAAMVRTLDGWATHSLAEERAA